MTSLEIFKPENWQDFEKISARLSEKLYKNSNINRYGRQGQRQNGVDILIESDEGIMGIQCKHTEDFSPSKIDAEIKKAEKFTPPLKSFKFFTTHQRDTKIQSYIAEKSQEYRAKNLFDIGIRFWEDISEKLSEPKNYDILEEFYPQVFYADVNISNILDVILKNYKNGNYFEVENHLNILNHTKIHLNDKNASKLHFLNGKFYELCNQYLNAGKEYIEAYQYQPDNPDLKYYHALGLYFTNKIEKSRNICKNLLKENCNEKIYALSVLLNKLNEKEIRDEFKNSDQVLYSLILNSSKLGDYTYSVKLLDKIDIGNDVKKSINYCMIKLAHYYENRSFNVDYLHNNELERIEKILQTCFDSFTDRIFVNYLNQFYKLLQLNYNLKHQNQLNKNIERGLKLDSNNSNILYYKALSLHENGDEYGAINILEDIIFELPGSFRYLSLILIEKNDYKEIIKLGEKLLPKLDEDSDNYLFCCDVLVDAFLNEKRNNDAENLINSMKDSSYKNLLKSKLSNNISNKEYYLNKCYEQRNSLKEHHKIILAKNYMSIGLFKRAITIYESCLNSKIYSNDLEDLMECYYNNNDYTKIIDISEYFISKKEFYQYFLELEIDICLKINDYNKSNSLIEIYKKEFESNFKIELANAKIDFILKKYDKVDTFLNKKYPIKDLEINQCMDLYELYKLRECSIQKILDLLYDIRLYHYNTYDWIHEWYVVEILLLNIDFKKPKYVDYNTGISVKFIKNSQDLFLLENGEIKFKLNELNNFDSLKNHKIGDIVQIDKFGNEIEILNIYNKHKYAFDESYQNLDFEKTKMLKQIPVDESLESLFEIVKKHSDRILILTNYYRDHPVIISFFSKILNKDIYDTYFFLRRVGLKSFSPKELIREDNKNIILDITSLFTIHSLKIEKLIKDNFNLFISYSSINELYSILERTKRENNQESEGILEEDGKFYREEINYENKIKNIKKILEWVTSNCKTQPIKKLFELNENQLKIINQLKEYNYEDILLAMDNKCLISDDLIFKEMFKDTFNIETAGTLNLIEYLFSNKKIKKDKFEELLSQLFILNYIDVPISVELIYNMIKKGEYRVLIKFLTKSDEYSNFDSLAKQLSLKLNEKNPIEYVCYQMIDKTLFNQKYKNIFLNIQIDIDENM